MYVYWVFSTTLLFYIVPAVILAMLLPEVTSRDKRLIEDGQHNNSSLTSSVPTGAERSIQPEQDEQATDVVTKEVAPDFTFPVRDAEGKICILAKFSATFTITYPSQGGEEAVSVNLPESAQPKGRCGTAKDAPLLELSWPGYRLTMIFTTIPSSDKSLPDSWELQSMALQYNTGNFLFDQASNAGKQTARSQEGLHFFETPMGKSYFCPSPDMIPMLNTKPERVVLARLKDVRLQVYDVQKGKFSPAQRCSLVRIGGMEPFAQDETVPIAVGSTLAVVAVLVVIGYALYRNLAARKTDYNTME